MEIGEVGITSDATVIKGEMCRVRHEGITEIINEVEGTTDKLKKTTEMKTETREIEEIEGELDETTDEHTQVELVRDNGVELGECVGTQCEHRFDLPQEQRETVCSLEADRDQMGPVGPCEVEWMSDVNGYTWSLGGVEASGFLVRTPAPDVMSQCVWWNV